MMFKTKSKLSLVLCAILLFSMIFSGCSIKEDSVESRTLCQTMLDYIIQDDYEAAYQMIQAVASQDEFDNVWYTMRDVLKNTKSYEIQ